MYGARAHVNFVSGCVSRLGVWSVFRYDTSYLVLSLVLSPGITKGCGLTVVISYFHIQMRSIT